MTKPTIAMADTGLFVSLAEQIAPRCAKLWYTSPGYRSSYPRKGPCSIGEGIPGVTRVQDLDDIEEKPDYYLFPDVGWGSTELRLASEGNLVWGARGGEELELKRLGAKKLMAKAGMPIGPYKVIVGIDQLWKYLLPRKHLYVKCDTYRGDFETTEWVNRKLSEEEFTDILVTIGPSERKTRVFIVEESIDGVEAAIDTFSVDGEFPDAALVGIESKGSAYLAAAMRWDAIGESLRGPYEKLAPLLKQYRYRQEIALETRITPEGKGFVVDPCCRSGFLPSEAMQLIHPNLLDVILAGAEGRLVQPQIAAKWVAALVISSSRAEKHQLAVEYPPSLARFVKLRCYSITDGTRYCYPGDVSTPSVGCVLGMGASAREAIDACKSHAKQVEAPNLCYEEGKLDEALDNWRKLAARGVTRVASDR